MQAGKAGWFQPSHASFPQDQVRPMRSCLVHNPPASIGYRGFVFAVGPFTTLGLVGDSGRTVRSLSAASKPRITQRTARNTPSIQEEGEEHIFFHFLSFSFIFFHFLCLCWVLKIGFFSGLNFVTISLNSSYVKNRFLGPSRVLKHPFGPSFPFFPTFFSPVFCLFSCFLFFHFFIFCSFHHFLIFIFFLFLFSFFPKKKFLLFFFLVLLSNIFNCWR